MSSTACWDLRRLREAIKDEEFSQRFLALHALSGSDTTSRTYLKGTMKYLKVGSQLLECCTPIVRLRVHFSRHCDFNQLSD